MKTQKIIFLDFDGVLNSQLYYVNTKGQRKYIEESIDKDAVKLLNELCKETGANVVVSSTWRLGRTDEELQTLLDGRGFEHKVIGKTKDLRVGEAGDCILRGNEILHWMKEHKDIIGCDYWEYKHYLILDDDSDMLYWQKDNFICTDPYCGMTPRTVFQGKKILNAPWSIKDMT